MALAAERPRGRSAASQTGTLAKDLRAREKHALSAALELDTKLKRSFAAFGRPMACPIPCHRRRAARPSTLRRLVASGMNATLTWSESDHAECALNVCSTCVRAKSGSQGRGLAW